MDPTANQQPVNPAPSFPVSPAATPPQEVPAFQAIAQEDAPPTPNPTNGAGAPPPLPTSTDQPPAADVVSGSENGKSNKNKILATLGVLLMLLGVGAGVYLVRNQQLLQTSAWDCSLYTFSLSEGGTVSVANGSSRDEPEQQAQVFINGSLVDTFNVPALAPGEGATLGTVSVPTNQTYSWSVEGTKDCNNSGTRHLNEVTASCSAVIAYDEDWQLLTATDLSNLSTGDVVRFTVSGTASSGSFDKARFSVNGSTPEESTDKRPSSNDFYFEYTIPANTTTFNVTAEVFHSELGWF